MESAVVLRKIELQLVLSLGSKAASVPVDLPGNPIVMAYAPQLELLRRARLVITHGGLNTTLESLSEGLPLIALPIVNDQPGVAARIKHFGWGDFIPIQKLTAPKLRTMIRHLLESASHQERTRNCAEQLRQIDGPAKAAALIIRGLNTRERQLNTDLAKIRGFGTVGSLTRGCAVERENRRVRNAGQ